MARKQFEIIVEFEYANGTKPNGKLQTVVSGKPAIARQCDANRDWLAQKQHRLISTTVLEIGTYIWSDWHAKHDHTGEV